MSTLLVNCSLESNAVVSDLEAAQNDITSQELFIVPNSATQYVPGEYITYTIAAQDFQDFTEANMSPDNWDGVISRDTTLAGNPLDIKFTDTVGAYQPGNKVKVTINLENSFSLSSDRTITIDIGGEAKSSTEREAVIGLSTDFAHQVRGGNIVSYNEETGPYTTSYTGVAGLGKVTFTPATGITDPRGGDFAPAITSAATSDNRDYLNDFKAQNSVIYAKGTFTTDRSGPDEGWVYVGEITVELDSTAVAAAIAANQIPDGDKEGEYGYIFRKAHQDGNDFVESSSAISKENWDWNPSEDHSKQEGMSPLALKSHRLEGLAHGTYQPELPESNESDLNTDYLSTASNVTFSRWSDADEPWDGSIQGTSQSSAKSYLCTRWRRRWYFRYPTDEELAEAHQEYSISAEDTSFWHVEDSDMATGNFNSWSDLSLSGFLGAFPPPPDANLKAIFSIDFETDWNEINLNEEVNGWIGFGTESQSDGAKAHLIPWGGNDLNNNPQVIVITGNPGAKFRVEIDEVEVVRAIDGKSTGENTINTFRNLVQWDNVLSSTDVSDNNELGTTNILEIGGDMMYRLALPSIEAYTGANDYRNYYLRIISVNNTYIQTNAHDHLFGANITSDTLVSSFTNGLNWTDGPGNTIQIRLRQQSTSVIELNGNIEGFGDSAAYDAASGTNSVYLYEYNQNNPGNAIPGEQVIDFRFLLKGDGAGYWTFNPNYYQETSTENINSDFNNTQAEHAAIWPASNCTVTYEWNGSTDQANTGQCSINNISKIDRRINDPSLNWDGEDRFLITHNFPTPPPEDLDYPELIVNGDFSQGEGTNVHNGQTYPVGWSAALYVNSQPTTISLTDNKLRIYGSPLANSYGDGWVEQEFFMTAGRTYDFTANLINCGGAGGSNYNATVSIRKPNQGWNTHHEQISSLSYNDGYGLHHWQYTIMMTI